MVLFVVSNETQAHNQGIIYLGKILSGDWTEIELGVISQWVSSSFPNIHHAQCLLLKPKIMVIKIMIWKMLLSVPHLFICYQFFITVWFQPVLSVFHLKVKVYFKYSKGLWQILQDCSNFWPVTSVISQSSQYWEFGHVKFKGGAASLSIVL